MTHNFSEVPTPKEATKIKKIEGFFVVALLLFAFWVLVNIFG